MKDIMRAEIIYEVGSIPDFIANHSTMGGSLVSINIHKSIIYDKQ